jgi:hypothetical protein
MDIRKPEIIEMELKDLRAVIKIHEELLQKFPEDKVIKLSLEQYRFRERELLKELERTKLHF